jgi:hypothetical protein
VSKLVKVLPWVNAAAVVVVGLVRFNWPASFWPKHVYTTLAALGLTALTPIVQATVAEKGEKRRREQAEQENSIQPFLATSLIFLARHGGANWEKTGIQAFLVANRGWRRQEEHIRLAKIRIAAIPSSGIRWTKGKGAIGRCWETKAPQFIDLEEHFADLQHVDESGWNTLTAEQRIGLTYSDFKQVNGKYGVVAAVPIMDREGKYRGCGRFAPRGNTFPRSCIRVSGNDCRPCNFGNEIRHLSVF